MGLIQQVTQEGMMPMRLPIPLPKCSPGDLEPVPLSPALSTPCSCSQQVGKFGRRKIGQIWRQKLRQEEG